MERASADSTWAWLGHPNPLVRWGGRAWLLLGLVLVAWVAWVVAGRVRIALVPLVLALFPAAVLLPVVDRLDRGRVGRSVPAFAATLGFVLVLVGLVALLGWQVGSELSGVTDQLRSAWQDARSTIRGLPGLSGFEPTSLLDGSGGGGDSGGSGGAGVGGLAASAAAGVVRFGTELFLGIVALFFYLRDGDRIAAWLAGLFPEGRRDDARSIGARSWDTISGYIRGQTLVALFDGVLFAIGLVILGVPLAIALGVLVFLGAFVPVVGSIVAGAVAVLVALVTKGVVTGLITLALIVGVQQLEGNVLAPLVLGREVALHPLAVLVAITVGASVLGPFGAIVAVPLAASLYHAASYLRHEAA